MMPDPANDPANFLPVADEAWTIRPADWERFAAHAAPEAIEHQLRRVKAMRRAAQRDIERLAELAGRRGAEIAAGTWPARPDGDMEAL